MKEDKDYKKVLDLLQDNFGWADTKDMNYMEKDLINDTIKAVKKQLSIYGVVGQSEQLCEHKNKTQHFSDVFGRYESCLDCGKDL